MNSWHHSRRVFLSQAALGVGGAVLSTVLPERLLAAHKYAKRAATTEAVFKFLTAAEAADVNAFAAVVIPSDETPGATEANVTYFIDHVLTEYEPGMQKDFRVALGALDGTVKKTDPTARFAELNSKQQMDVVSEFEKVPTAPRRDLLGNFFAMEISTFELLRDYVLAGFLSDPDLGGNKDMIGWQLIGYDGMAGHEPPFGFYDAELLKQAKEPK